MTRDELTDRVTELFPRLAEVEPWQWAETEEGEPVVVVERHASFTGLDGGDVDLTAPIPNTSEIGVWRIEPSGRYELKGLMDDPIAKAAAKQATNTLPFKGAAMTSPPRSLAQRVEVGLGWCNTLVLAEVAEAGEHNGGIAGGVDC